MCFGMTGVKKFIIIISDIYKREIDIEGRRIAIVDISVIIVLYKKHMYFCEYNNEQTMTMN